MLMYKPLTVTLTVVVMLDELDELELEELELEPLIEELEDLEMELADVIRLVISFIFPTLFQFISSRF